MNYATFVGEEVADAASAEDGERWQRSRGDVAQIAAGRRAGHRADPPAPGLRPPRGRPAARCSTSTTSSRDIEQLLRRTIGEHVELVTSLAADLWPVLADPGQIEQVLVNLAVNARDAMPGGGTLTIDTDNVAVDDDYAPARPDWQPGGHVRLRVSDTGSRHGPGRPRPRLRAVLHHQAEG